jgi:branched-chain amino acid transport system substrate-binding protein
VRQDGRALVPAVLLQVKTPEESRSRWDYCKVVTEISGVDAAKPLAQGGCPLVKT